MNRLLALVLTILTALLHMLFGTPRVEAKAVRGSSISVSSEDGAGPFGCGDLRITFDGTLALTAEEMLTIPAAEAGELRAKVPSGSGVHVIGWDRSDTSVVACKAAPDRGALGAISVSRQGREISLSGPKEGDWIVYLIVRAPHDAAIDVEAENGPIDLSDLSGTIRARTVNGPLSVESCSGDVTGSTRNGPIDFTGGGRNVDLRAQNGPVTVKLEGTAWDGGSLIARTQNGPLDLILSDGFTTGVEVESSGHSPLSCNLRECDRAERVPGDEGRLVRLGRGETAIHLSTINGPVSIRSPKNEI